VKAVGEALVRYINQGITLGSVNLPEINIRSLTLEEPNHARVAYIHRNVPGVLRKVNEILGSHNVDKQISDSRGDIAYLIADVSEVRTSDIKEISDSLEALSCKCPPLRLKALSDQAASSNHDSRAVLKPVGVPSDILTIKASARKETIRFLDLFYNLKRR
jgi:hypothetical protein